MVGMLKFSLICVRGGVGLVLGEDGQWKTSHAP